MNGPQHQVLEEVMESQTISLIKKGFVHEMSANVSIISAANPNSGAYDNSKNVWENIKCNASVISKFDLVFVLNDSPDEELDSKLSEEVLLSRRQNGSNARNSESKSVHSTNRSFSSQFTYNNNNNRNDCNLMLKLIYGPEEEEPDLIPHCLLKKYVSFAQQYIHPVVSHEAKEMLNAFSQEIAKSKITKSKTKQLELLYRLTESRAKLELRSEATLEDAMDVIDIVKHSINNQLIVSTIAQPIRGSTKRAKAHNLIKALQTVSQQTQQNLFSVKEIIEICYKFKLEFDGKEDIMEAIDKLNNETLLLLQNGSNYKLNLQNY
jgi:DNA helicase MCM8